MKKIIFRFKQPLVALGVLVLVSWLAFPYLFSNQTWSVKKQFRVVDDGWTTLTVGTPNDFPDTRIVGLFYDAKGDETKVMYSHDIVDGTPINRGDVVYAYALRDDVYCVSHYDKIKDYGLRWRYYLYCDYAPIKSSVVFILLCAFIGLTFEAFAKKME